ncbi:hypothetical protein D3C77_441870 [compost metagenome]
MAGFAGTGRAVEAGCQGIDPSAYAVFSHRELLAAAASLDAAERAFFMDRSGDGTA